MEFSSSYSNEAGCQTPRGTKNCIKTMDMWDKILKEQEQEQAILAASSIVDIVNGSSISSSSNSNSNNRNNEVILTEVEKKKVVVDKKPDAQVNKQVEGPRRCSTCSKRVGLTGFNCKCGHLFCSVHRYSDKHDCPYDYRTAAREAIAKANPVVKAEKLHNKI